MRVNSGLLPAAIAAALLWLAPAAAGKAKPAKAPSGADPPCVTGLIRVADGYPKPAGGGWTVSYNVAVPKAVSLIRKGVSRQYGQVIGLVQASYSREIPLKPPVRAPARAEMEGREPMIIVRRALLQAHVELQLRHWSGTLTREWRKAPLHTLPGMGMAGIDPGTTPQPASLSSTGLGFASLPGVSWRHDDTRYLLCRGPIGRGLALEARIDWCAGGEESFLADYDNGAELVRRARQALAPYEPQAQQALTTLLNGLHWNGAVYANLKPGPPEEPTEAALRLTVRAATPLGTGPVEGARCTVRLPDNREVTGVTGSVGQVTLVLPLRDPRTPLPVKVVAVQADAATVYHVGGAPCPSLLRAGWPATWTLDRTVALTPASSFEGAADIQLPLCVVEVRVRQWNSQAKQSLPASLPVMIKNTEQKSVLQAEPDQYRAPGELRLFIPPRDAWKIDPLTLVGYDRAVKNRRDAACVPAPAAGDAPLTIELDANELAWRLQRLRERLIALFMPLVGIERASALADVKIAFVTTPGARYLDGVMQLEQNYDPTEDEPSESLLHEWSHHIANVLTPDPGVEDRVGGTHELWKRADNRETAWDEARAHFLALELSRAFRMPHTGNFQPDAAVDVADRQPPGGGGQVEGVIATALLDHYHRTGYGAPDRVLADFLAAEDEVRRRTGHPPRTVEEFLVGKAARMDARPDTVTAQRQDLLTLAERFRLLPAP